MTQSLVLEARGVRKAFGGVVALQDASLQLARGSVHALLGENGAGKSTLMKVLAGVHRPDSGTLTLEGQPYTPTGPADANRRGVVTVYQELSLVPELSVAENLFLGELPGRFGLVSFAQMREACPPLLAKVGLTLAPDEKVGALSLGERQLLEIARALRQSAKVLSLDEPTAVLSPTEAKRLFEVVRTLKDSGVAIIYVSHRLEEVLALADHATVLRDGQTVAELPLEGVAEDELIRLMVGRSLQQLYPMRTPAHGDVRLKVLGLSRPPAFEDVSFEVKAGEIVGIGGLVGAGRTEVLRAIFGADEPSTGTVEVEGTVLPPGNPRASVAAGVGFLSEDRKEQGLALGRSVRENASLATLQRYVGALGVSVRNETNAVANVLASLKVRTHHLDSAVSTLSGGNQQKVLLGRWLLSDPKVLLFDEPTRGVDVGARAEIYEHIAALSAKGLAIVMVSSDIGELTHLCDRVLVMAEGRLRGSVSGSQATAEAILTLATPPARARATT